MTEPKTVAGKWGPMAFALSPVTDTMMLLKAAMDMEQKASKMFDVADDKLEQFKQEATPRQRDLLWTEYIDLMREGRVLESWAHIAGALYVFANEGCKSRSVPDMTEIEIVHLPIPEQS